MPVSSIAHRLVTGVFTGTLITILTKKARSATMRNKYRGLRLHNFAAKLTLTTLLAFLLMAGIESNPGPPTPDNTSSSKTDGILSDLIREVKTLTQAVTDLKSQQQRLEAAQVDNTKTLSSRLDKLSDNQDILTDDVTSLYEKFEDMQTSQDNLVQDNVGLVEQFDYLENQSRRNNLMFHGIPQAENESWEDCERKVLRLIKEKLNIAQSVLIERAHRVGSAIVARFQSFKDRDLVLSRAKQLKGTDIFIREDLSKRLRQKQNGLKPLMTSLRNDGKRAVLSHDKLKTEEGTFTFNIEKQQIEKINDTRLPPFHHRHSLHSSPRHHHQQRHNFNGGGGAQTGNNPNRRDRRRSRSRSSETDGERIQNGTTHNIDNSNNDHDSRPTRSWANIAQNNDNSNTDRRSPPTFSFTLSNSNSNSNTQNNVCSNSAGGIRAHPYSSRGGRGGLGRGGAAAAAAGPSAGRGRGGNSLASKSKRPGSTRR